MYRRGKVIEGRCNMKWRVAVLCSVTALIVGCSQMGYYFQAAQGQISVLSSARPIDDWLADTGTNDKLRSRLEKIKAIREFAEKELGLPDNASFKSYADLKRPYVLWNVVATPELSLHSKQWCFPVAGCVSYRGYYDKQEAQAYGDELRHEGFDVQVAGVPAYSTLGWFSDPVLSTFIQYPDAELARLIFHELAHQVAYAKGDSRFNESFATAVEEVGVERWLSTHGNEQMRQSYATYEGRKHDFLALLLKYRKELDNNYTRRASAGDKRKQKAAIFQALKDEYQTLKTAWGGYAGYDRWFAEPLTNAHLASIATYHDMVPEFRALLVREKSFPKFYDAVKRLAAMEDSERHRQLALLARPTTSAALSLKH